MVNSKGQSQRMDQKTPLFTSEKEKESVANEKCIIIDTEQNDLYSARERSTSCRSWQRTGKQHSISSGKQYKSKGAAINNLYNRKFI